MEYVTYTIGKVEILSLSDNLDRYTAPLLRSWFEQHIANGPIYLVVNIKGLNYMDSSGLAALVSGLNRSRKFKGDLYLCNLPRQIRMLFELTRLDKVFEIYPTEQAAVQAFASLEIIS